jgi:hypothetical protein
MKSFSKGSFLASLCLSDAGKLSSLVHEVTRLNIYAFARAKSMMMECICKTGLILLFKCIFADKRLESVRVELKPLVLAE